MDQINGRKFVQLVGRVPVEKQLDIAGVAADGERGEDLVGESADEFHPPRVTLLDAGSRLYFTQCYPPIDPCFVAHNTAQKSAT